MLLPLPLLNCYGIVLIAVISKCSWRFWLTCLGFGKCCSGLVNPQADAVRFSPHQNPCSVPLPHPDHYYFVLMQKNSSFANPATWRCQFLPCSVQKSQVFIPIQWRLWNSVLVSLNNLSSIIVNGQNTQVVDPTWAFVFIALLMSQIPGFLISPFR